MAGSSVAHITRMCPSGPRSSSLDDIFSKMSFCITYQACSGVSMHALNTHDAPLGPHPPLRPQFSRGYCHRRTALHVGSKRASNRAPKHHLCALKAHFALFPGTQSITYLRYRRAYHTAIEDRPFTPSLPGLFWGVPGGGRCVCGGVRSANQLKVTR
jgi:hypothetical protein